MKRLAALVLLVATAAHADPWVDERPGHGSFFFGYSYSSGGEYFAGNQPLTCPVCIPGAAGSKQPVVVVVPSPAFSSIHLATYTAQTMLMTGEVSLYRRLGFVFSAPMMKSVSEALLPGGTASFLGVGALVLGLKYQLPVLRHARGFAFGPQLYLTTPTGNQNARTSLPSMTAPRPVPLQTGTRFEPDDRLRFASA